MDTDNNFIHSHIDNNEIESIKKLISSSKILIVDDEMLAKITMGIIEDFGCNDVNYTTNWKETLKHVSNTEVDLIIMDINLGRESHIDGIELASLIKNKFDISVIYLTAQYDEDLITRARYTGPSGYFIKPIDTTILISNIEIALYNQKMKTENLKLKKIVQQTIHSMEKTVSLRDPYTANHQSWVSILSKKIAEEMEMDEMFIEGVYYSGLVHEYGKIFVPSEILSKPGKLTENQFKFILEHPVNGYMALKDIDFPWPIATAVLQHHERIDGSGYPYGISGDKIIKEARIISIADVIVSSISYKPYRIAKTVDSALEELENHSGIKFDKEIVEIAVDLFRKQNFSF